MDCVYICRSGENEELRYSIRSLLKNTNYKNIWVVGNKPDWYEGNFIPVTDIGNKYRNIQNCLSVIASFHEISEDFILMNDDFYIMNKIENIPTFYNGLLMNRIDSYINLNGRNQYSRILSDAQNKIIRFGKEQPLNYEVHLPMQMNRLKLKTIINFTLAPRSMYGNFYNVGGIDTKDVKIYKYTKDIDFSSNFLSSEDNSFNNILDILIKNFPDKTEYEKY